MIGNEVKRVNVYVFCDSLCFSLILMLLSLQLSKYCNERAVTPKCESEARMIVSRKKNMQLVIQALQCKLGIFSFEQFFEGRK